MELDLKISINIIWCSKDAILKLQSIVFLLDIFILFSLRLHKYRFFI